MLRRVLVTAVSVAALAGSAHAVSNPWGVTAAVNPVGAVTFPGTCAGMRTTAPAINTPADCSFTIPAGYELKTILLDGKAANMDALKNLAAGKFHAVKVNLAYKTFTVSTVKPAEGVFSPAKATKIKFDASADFKVLAKKGYRVTGVSVDGAPLAMTAATDIPIINGGAAKVTVPNVNADRQVSATFEKIPFSKVLLYPVVDQTRDLAWFDNPANAVVLDAGRSNLAAKGTGSGKKWTIVDGPSGGATLSAASGDVTQFRATLDGTYTVQVEVTDANGNNTAANGYDTWVTTASLKIKVMPRPKDGVCAGCHSGFKDATGDTIVTSYEDSKHAVIKAGATKQNAACEACHVQHLSKTDPKNACAGCHTAAAQFAASIHKTNPYHKLSCVDCHQSNHNPVPKTAAESCVTCHGPYAVEIIGNYTKSSHNTGHGSYYGMQISAKGCATCHNPHTTIATATDGKTDSCGTCHTYRDATHNYSIYTDGTYASMKAPHGEGKAPPAAGAVNPGDSISQYVTQGAVCTDCHGHDNTINAGFAEGGHGKVSSDPLNAFTHYDWSGRANNGTRQNGNCDRCHTAGGFAKLLGDTAVATRLAPQAGKPSNVLVCITCHTSVEGGLRTGATPAGSPAGALSNGYFALFSSAASGITAGNTKIQVQFPGFKNSSICIPCHSGRTTDKVFIETIAKSNAAMGNYSTISTGMYQHAANIAQTFIGKGAYDFSDSLAAVGAGAHTTIKMGATDTQGPCVACHYSEEGKTHSLEVKIADTTCATANCHAAGFSQASYLVEEENYKAAVKALTELIHAKFDGLRATSNPLEMERQNVRFGRFMKQPGEGADAATATKAYGAWYNWQLLTVWDKAAFVHNTNYARKIVGDTLDYLDDGTVGNGSVEKTILASTSLSAVEKAAAADFVAGGASKIMDRHAATSSTYKVQYTLNGSTSVTCATCHNPVNEVAIQAEARKAWAESGHGEVSALPWIPASNHLWRNAGFSASYASAASGSDCVRCHTPEGFAQFVGGATPFTNVSPVASAADAAVASPLNCNACHVNGLNAASDRLAVPQVTVFYNISTAGVQKTHLSATFPDVGESNMCIPCHAGRTSGAALADAGAKGMNFTTNSFQNSHYMAAAGLMYVKSGFTAFVPATTQVPGTTDSYGQTMTSDADTTVKTDGSATPGKLTSTHRKLGTAAVRGDSHNPAFFIEGNLDTNGPCVTCHLQGYTNAGTKRPGAGHTLAIDQAAWDQVCNSCHSAEAGFTPEGQSLLVEEEKIPFDDAMAILKNLVQNRLNCEYDAGLYPYFFKAGLPHTTANAFKSFGNVKNEGAAFNLNLLTREPYAYVHARTYTRRLIYDTVDYLDDGLINLSVGTYLTKPVVDGGLGKTKPVDASGTTEDDKLFQYFLKYDRTTKAWNTATERP